MVEHESKIIEVDDELVYCVAKITGNDHFRYFLLDNNRRLKSEFPFAGVDKPDEHGNYTARTPGGVKECGNDFTHEEVIKWALAKR